MHCSMVDVHSVFLLMLISNDISAFCAGYVLDLVHPSSNIFVNV